MACLRPPDENLSLTPAELAFASLAFRLAWSRIACEFVERRDLTDAARDLLARAVLSNIKQPLGEPEVVASRALRPFREILPVAALDRDQRDKVPDPGLNARACRDSHPCPAVAHTHRWHNCPPARDPSYNRGSICPRCRATTANLTITAAY